MGDEESTRRESTLYDPDSHPELYDSVLSRRIVAFVIDAIVVALLMIPAALVLFILVILTLGLAFILYGALFAIVAIGYIWVTLGGPNSATIGMRIVGIEMRTWNGGRSFPVLAVMHALIFWFSISLLTPLVLLVGLFTRRRQLLQDLLLGTLILNSDPLRALED